ncbi:hypothetical protein NL676_001480 [Syzygium grande]|nr:hypothetical protein NL676_001480 [Syzygium grande]
MCPTIPRLFPLPTPSLCNARPGANDGRRRSSRPAKAVACLARPRSRPSLALNFDRGPPPSGLILVGCTELHTYGNNWVNSVTKMQSSSFKLGMSTSAFRAFFSANAAAQASRKSSRRVTNHSVQKAAAALRGYDHHRATTVSDGLDAQQKKLNLLVLPTPTIGSFPQTMELRKSAQDIILFIMILLGPLTALLYRISEEEHVEAIKEEINKVVKLQEELDIDVMVHGEPEVRQSLTLTLGKNSIGVWRSL